MRGAAKSVLVDELQTIFRELDLVEGRDDDLDAVAFDDDLTGGLVPNEQSGAVWCGLIVRSHPFEDRPLISGSQSHSTERGGFPARTAAQASIAPTAVPASARRG